MKEQKYEHSDPYNLYSDIYENFWIAQTFTPQTAHKQTRIALNLAPTRKVGGTYDATGPLIVSIKATDENGKPTGEDIVSKSIIGEECPNALDSFYFDTHEVTEKDVKYAIVARYLRTTDHVKIHVYRGSTDSYVRGQCATSDDSGDTWTLQDYDLRFDDWGYVDTLDAEPKVVSIVTSDIATRMPIQRKSLWAVGRFWSFYGSDRGGEVRFRTSTDGVYWTEPTTIDVSKGGADFSVWLDGTDILHYSLGYSDAAGGGPVPFSYRMGTLNADGTITWTDDAQLIEDYCADPVIAVDSEGYPWIAYLDGCFVGSGYPYVVKSSVKDGTWITADDFPYKIKDAVDYNIIIVPLTEGKMFVTYAKLYGTASKLLGRLWNGEAWGDEETLSTSDVDTTSMGRFSSIVIGDVVHTAFLGASTYFIKHVVRNADGSTVEKTVVTATSNYSSPVLTINEATGDLYCLWAKSHRINCKKYDAKTQKWSANALELINEDTETLSRSDRISAFYKVDEGISGVLYHTKAAVPYNVKFASFTPGSLVFDSYLYGKVSERAVSKSDMDAECRAEHGPYYEYDVHLKTCVRKTEAPPLITLQITEPQPTPKKLKMEILEPPSPRVIVMKMKDEHKVKK